MPFHIKRKVVESAFNVALLYGCESWLGCTVKATEKLYIGAIKALLGVRASTCTDLGYVEIGMPPLQDLLVI